MLEQAYIFDIGPNVLFEIGEATRAANVLMEPIDVAMCWIGESLAESWARNYTPMHFEKFNISPSESRLLYDRLNNVMRGNIVQLRRNVRLPSTFPVDFTVSLIDRSSVLIRSTSNAAGKYKAYYL